MTETFSLSHLIGSSLKATLLQLGYCLLLYNLMQLIKVYVARDGDVLASTVSMFYLFNDVKRELSAWPLTPALSPEYRRVQERGRRPLRLQSRGERLSGFAATVSFCPRCQHDQMASARRNRAPASK